MGFFVYRPENHHSKPSITNFPYGLRLLNEFAFRQGERTLFAFLPTRSGNQLNAQNLDARAVLLAVSVLLQRRTEFAFAYRRRTPEV